MNKTCPRSRTNEHYACSVFVCSLPALEPFRSEFEFPLAGEYGASFELQPLYKRSNTAEACNHTPTIYKVSAANDSPSNKVAEGGHPDLCLSVSNKPIKRCSDTNINRITSRQPSDPPFMSALPGSPAPSTVADSDRDPLLPSGAMDPSATPTPPVAASPAASRLGSLSQLRRKREHEESEGDDDGGSGEGNMCKRRCVLDSQDSSLSV
jgi:hypothetical protein